LAVAALAARASTELQFNRDIRPILSDNCFACHGTDPKHREADLRLDQPETAFAVKDGVAAITPGNPGKSEVWQRIIATDPDDLMPPAKAHKKLTAAQKETIKRWIEQGAKYQKHWAYETPTKPSVPSRRGILPGPDLPGASADSNPIDAFLQERLASEGLAMQPEADRPALIRRAAFALTGLPPTVAEVEAFIADSSPRAYEKMVDRYLASPRFGEEMARHWLDVARYADTHGLHLDNERSMWPYRDWVVKAFNQDLPFDQFTVWQIAGDLLPGATPDQVTATGFNRCNVTTSEGGAIAEEFLYRYAVDRTSTLFTTWMGLTGGCAVCHDHKYDPLSTREFYSMYSFFYSAADPGMDKNIALTEPVQMLPQTKQQAALEQAKKAEAAALQTLLSAATKAEYAEPAPAAPRSQRLVIFDDDFPMGADVKNTSRNPATWFAEPAFGTVSGSRALRQEGGRFFEDTITFRTLPLVLPENPRLEAWVWLDPQSPPTVLSIVIDGRSISWGEEAALRSAKSRPVSESRQAGPLPKPGHWTRLSFDPITLGLKPGTAIKTLSVQQVGGIVAWDLCTLTGDVRPEKDGLSSFLAWWKGAAKAASPDVPPALAKALSAGPEKTTDPAQQKALRDFYLARVAHPVTEEIAQKRALFELAQARRAAAEEAIPATLVFRDLPKPRPAFIMLRGQYDKPGEPVQPALPAFLPAPKSAAPSAPLTRLDLAKWLVAPEHPLTARVTVNRFWQQLFGVGLVKTSHDFGSQGEPPSHAELLDWLAVDFREHGWDVKSLVRLMVTSRAFRQQPAASPELRTRDPENRLLARGPRFRLDAEQIRDNALFVSGLLDLTPGGRGVRTYQPPNIWEPVGYSDSNTRYYLQDHGSALYRRSLYAYLKRTAPPPFMSNFDAPDREQSCTRRERTNTPMQALQLMNDVQHFEAARALAERTLAECQGADEARLAWLFRTVLARTPDTQETAMLVTALNRQRQLFAAEPKAAAKAVDVGESPARLVAPAPETAAWTLLANLVLNLDETLNRN
jgi:hypothetical protein